MSIQITITGGSAAEVKELVHDLAGTLAGMDDAKIPAKTEVSTLAEPEPAEETKPRRGNSAKAEVEEEPAAEVEEISDVELRKQASAVSKAGKREEVKALVDSFGVPNLTAIPQDKRAEFISRLEAL